MKKIALLIGISLIAFSCEKNDNDLIGKWKLVQGFDSNGGGKFSISIQNQRIEEYTDNIKILYDFEGNEITRCSYTKTNSSIILFGTELNGDKRSSSFEYWFQHDTLKIRYSGGWEFYDEFFIRIK